MAYFLLLQKSGAKHSLTTGETLTLPAVAGEVYRIIDDKTGRNQVPFQKNKSGKNMTLDVTDGHAKVVLTDYQDVCDSGTCPVIQDAESTLPASTTTEQATAQAETTTKPTTTATDSPAATSTSPATPAPEVTNPAPSPTVVTETAEATKDSGVSPWLIGGAGLLLLGGAAAAGGGSGGGGGSSTPTPTPTPADTTPPTVAISLDKTTVLTTQTSTVTFTFSEAVSDFSLASVVVVGGTLSNLTGSGTSYTATFTPSASASSSSIHIGNSAFHDAAGNANVDGADSNNTANLLVVADAAAIPAITNTQVSFTQVENAATGTVMQATGTNVASWTLSGADASKFTINSTGVVSFANTSALDFENPQDANHDGVYQFTINGVNSNNTATTTKDITISLTDVTELPDWLSPTAPYGTTNAGVQSLLSADGDKTGWAGADGSGTNTPVSLTYAFQNAGALLDNISGYGSSSFQTIHGSYTELQKAYIRSVFQNFSDVANVTFTENSSQAYWGADIRLFSDTASNLGVYQSTLGFSYLPYGQSSLAVNQKANNSFTDYQGNFWFVSDSSGMQNLTTPAFSTPFGDEQDTVTHELGHVMGLGHPFNSQYTNAGFFGYSDTASGHTSPNDYGVTTGGGHDTPLTDTVMESVMTYHNPNTGPYELVDGITLTATRTFTPNTLSIYDIAALQNLYGANMTSHTGDDNYTYSASSPSFATIWDGGGNDTITSVGSNSAYINLNEGTLSRVGATPGWQAHFGDLSGGVNTISSVSMATPSNGSVTVDGNGKGFTFTANEQPGGFNGTLDFQITYTNGTTVNKTYANFEPAATNESSLNLGIAFGVTIENAVGGSGNDTIIGNSAANHITGGLGNDTMTGGAGGDTFIFNGLFGNDSITDFTKGQDVIQLSSPMSSAAVTFAGNTMTVAGYGSIQLANVASMLAGTDYIYV